MYALHWFITAPLVPINDGQLRSVIEKQASLKIPPGRLSNGARTECKLRSNASRAYIVRESDQRLIGRDESLITMQRRINWTDMNEKRTRIDDASGIINLSSVQIIVSFLRFFFFKKKNLISRRKAYHRINESFSTSKDKEWTKMRKMEENEGKGCSRGTERNNLITIRNFE